MKGFLYLLSISIILFSCETRQKVTTNFESEILKIQKVSENIFVHISYLKTNDFGKVACNGMIYFNGAEAIVFDTPTDIDASKKLIHWIKNVQKKNIKAIVATHFHEDCLGGLQEFHASGIKSYANNATVDLLRKKDTPVLPQNGFDNEVEFSIGKESVYATFFGEGHTIDNIVGLIPNEKVLFGGCLIKSVNASKGYIGDANIMEWSRTVQKIKKENPDLKVVIPGHGKTGGINLLDYTITLFENK